MCEVDAAAHASSEFESDAYALAALPKGACHAASSCSLHVHDLCPGTEYPGPNQRWRCSCESGQWHCEITETSKGGCGSPGDSGVGNSGVSVNDSGAGASDSGATLALCEQHGPPQNAVLVHDTAGLLGGSATTALINGVVTALGDGFPPEIDPRQYGWQSTETRWIRIDGGSRVWTIAAKTLPPFGMRPGALAYASYFWTTQEFGPGRSMFELRGGDARNQLAFWYGTAGKVEELALPSDVKVTRRAATCMAQSECVAWREYALEMSVQGGKSVTLGTDESMLQGDYLFKNIRSAYQFGTSPCVDAYVADTTIVVAHASPFTGAEEDAGEDDAGR
jgi:hypothetical protein